MDVEDMEGCGASAELLPLGMSSPHAVRGGQAPLMLRINYTNRNRMIQTKKKGLPFGRPLSQAVNMKRKKEKLSPCYG
jgi:hypothetical protein